MAHVSPEAYKQRQGMSEIAEAYMEQAKQAGIPTEFDPETGYLTMGRRRFVLSDDRDLKSLQDYSVALHDFMNVKQGGQPTPKSAGEAIKQAAMTAPPEKRAQAVMTAREQYKPPEGLEEVSPGSGVYASKRDAEYVTTVSGTQPPEAPSGVPGQLVPMIGDIMTKLQSGGSLDSKEFGILRRILMSERASVRE